MHSLAAYLSPQPQPSEAPTGHALVGPGEMMNYCRSAATTLAPQKGLIERSAAGTWFIWLEDVRGRSDGHGWSGYICWSSVDGYSPRRFHQYKPPTFRSDYA